MSSSAKIAYARVSTDDQNLDRQLETLKEYLCGVDGSHGQKLR